MDSNGPSKVLEGPGAKPKLARTTELEEAGIHKEQT